MWLLHISFKLKLTMILQPLSLLSVALSGTFHWLCSHMIPGSISDGARSQCLEWEKGVRSLQNGVRLVCSWLPHCCLASPSSAWMEFLGHLSACFFLIEFLQGSFYSLFVYGLVFLQMIFIHIHACLCEFVHMCVIPVEARRGHQISCSWSYRQLGFTEFGMGTKLRSSGLSQFLSYFCGHDINCL